MNQIIHTETRMTYKQGVHGKFFYKASDGEWRLSTDQSAVQNLVDRIEGKAKVKKAKKRSTGSHQNTIAHDYRRIMQDGKSRTAQEVNQESAFFSSCPHAVLLSMLNRGWLRLLGKKVCPISGKSTKLYVCA